MLLTQVRGGSGDDAPKLHREAGGDGDVAALQIHRWRAPCSAGQSHDDHVRGSSNNRSGAKKTSHNKREVKQSCGD